MDIQFYWMKDRLKQFFLFSTAGTRAAWGIISQNITHNITIGKFMLPICIWQMTYLK